MLTIPGSNCCETLLVAHMFEKAKHFCFFFFFFVFQLVICSREKVDTAFFFPIVLVALLSLCVYILIKNDIMRRSL